MRDHLVHRFLEDPLISLSTIKDDDHIAAYKIPKLTKNAKYLQLVHRSQEQYVQFDNAFMHVKLFKHCLSFIIYTFSIRF